MMETRINGLRCLQNFTDFQSGPLLVCLHGNSSCAETFIYILEHAKQFNIQAIAFDLPGCGASQQLESYSMQIVGNIIGSAINQFVGAKVYLFGHSLGGHLLGFIPVESYGIILAGTPPLSSSADFPNAFTPNDEAMELLPLLSKQEQFSKEEATKFVMHTGITGSVLDLMIHNAMITDGKFRQGCLSTLASMNQIEWLSKYKNVLIFHATDDGVISQNYLELIDKNILFQNKIHYLNCKHMSPILKPFDMILIIKNALKL
jgi:pimeloyl-ACP methyl ester carboxylesterase